MKTRYLLFVFYIVLFYILIPFSLSINDSIINNYPTPKNISPKYYANIDIYLDENGFVNIKGESNSIEIKTFEKTSVYTTKTSSYWLFNLTLNETFEDYYFELHLPSNLELNYFKGPKLSGIKYQGDSFIIYGLGEGQLSILVQYKLRLRSNQNNFFLISVFTLIIILIIISFLIYFFNFRKKEFYNLNKLTPRQKEIFNFIKSSKKKIINQKLIEKELKLPKASVSRNINTLERKGFISKTKEGMSNVIKLLPPKVKKNN